MQTMLDPSIVIPAECGQGGGGGGGEGKSSPIGGGPAHTQPVTVTMASTPAPPSHPPLSTSPPHGTLASLPTRHSEQVSREKERERE